MEVVGFVMLHNGDHLEEKWFELETLQELVITWLLFSKHGSHDIWRKCNWNHAIFCLHFYLCLCYGFDQHFYIKHSWGVPCDL
jgi:hypothetical protein